MKRKRSTLADLKKEFLDLRIRLYQAGYWITPEALLLHVSEMGDQEVTYLFEEFLLRAYNLENDMRKSIEETRVAALETVGKHPLYSHLYHEMERRGLFVANDIYWILTGEEIEA